MFINFILLNFVTSSDMAGEATDAMLPNDQNQLLALAVVSSFVTPQAEVTLQLEDYNMRLLSQSLLEQQSHEIICGRKRVVNELIAVSHCLQRHTAEEFQEPTQEQELSPQVMVAAKETSLPHKKHNDTSIELVSSSALGLNGCSRELSSTIGAFFSTKRPNSHTGMVKIGLVRKVHRVKHCIKSQPTSLERYIEKTRREAKRTEEGSSVSSSMINCTP